MYPSNVCVATPTDQRHMTSQSVYNSMGELNAMECFQIPGVILNCMWYATPQDIYLSPPPHDWYLTVVGECLEISCSQA